jgi:lysozyme family protein
MTRFEICLPFTLAQECPFPQDWNNPKNFSNDLHDSGGKTFCGILQREYDMYRKHAGLYTRDVRSMTQNEGYEIYETYFWKPDCDKLGPGLDLSFFDEAVNAGVTEATKVLQSVLGIANDGFWGKQTQDAVDRIKDVPAVVQSFTNRRKAVYRMMHAFQYFGKDWIRRSDQIGRTALMMAKAA